MNLEIMQNFLVNFAFGGLLTAMLVYWSSLAFPGIFGLNKLASFITLFVNIALVLTLSSRWFTNGYFPLSNLYESLLFLSWGLTFVHLFIESKTKSRLIGAIAIPVAMFVTAFASLALPVEMQKASPLVPALKSNWLMMHVSIMMLSYSILILGSLLSILFLIITKGKDIDINLKGSSVGTGSYKMKNSDTVPSLIFSSQSSVVQEQSNILTNSTRMNLLESIDNLSYRTIGLGFPLLTIGIIAGAVWANEAWGSYWSWDPKETWALITWLIFASYLHSRITKSWQGKKPAILASLGFVVVWICYLGVNFLGKGLHSYGWLT
uniref:Cytochrome c biogenesis protein CcsA n=1 Tax=Pyropia perforata TaxID=182771 RepID=A0A023HRP4_PYRPE|nr:cytochrome c heme attachment protein [Neoporphyra perforata]AGQ17168.1 cytochrome c heme attachment protein [Neoporphyra perforata]AHB35147.1 cytochrome c heme attachment protein [Neoporphyra perforata]AHB35355.1 cytochrome c heme attachment protein [Neoporphyra perforata]AIA19518.1 cytochrome c heme attachment protein [Neoporphyra perforata]AIA19727.1 cytochrome c heme attachment protein [Neoporphyra perforata]